MGSSRLPGKTLMELGGYPLLEWAVTRAARARLVDEVVVATSTDTADDRVADLAIRLGARCIRGSIDDVLDRYRQACLVTGAGTVVRVTADCPLIEPEIIDATVSTLAAAGADYASTSLDGRFPRGLDTEAVRASVLLLAAGEAVDPPEREHVTLFVYRRPGRFKCVPVVAPAWADRPDLRVTVDEADDLAVLRAAADAIGASPQVHAGAVLEFLSAHPEVAAGNAAVRHRNVS